MTENKSTEFTLSVAIPLVHDAIKATVDSLEVNKNGTMDELNLAIADAASVLQMAVDIMTDLHEYFSGVIGGAEAIIQLNSRYDVEEGEDWDVD